MSVTPPLLEVASTPGAEFASPQRRGNRKRDGRGGHTTRNVGQRSSAQSDKVRGGRRGGRGRVARGESSKQGLTASNDSAEEPPPGQLPPVGQSTFGVRPTGDASLAKDGGKENSQEDLEVEACFICTSPVVYNSVSPCNHRTCHICALRWRALYKNKNCAHCRASSEWVIFTTDAHRRYDDYTAACVGRSDQNLGIKYETTEIFEDTCLLLRYNCPDPNCDVACDGWPGLHRHVKSVHHKIMCDLCTRNKKVFTHEHELFTKDQLRKHEKYGDDSPGAADQSGFKGHPECGFCRQRFYDDDELYNHCREKHERCYICDRCNPGGQVQYYVDYNSLETHFTKDHFLCPERDCLEKKFVVFASEMDLKAHQLEEHPHGLSKDARRDARRIDMSEFAYRTPHEPERNARRESRGRGRGRDPNTEPLPMSSAQPLRRDELAFQRQMAIQSAQSVSTRNFGGQLTSADAFVARLPPRTQEPSAAVTPRLSTTSTPGSLNISPSAPGQVRPSEVNGALTPQEQAKRLRHTAVIERAANMLKNDQTKLAKFRSRVSSFRNSIISAPELIDAFFSLFDTSSTELGKLIKELAEIFEITARRDSLLKAWSDWRAINEDYPSLPGPSGVPAGIMSSALTSGGSRVLRLKSSTAQSSRSAAGRQGIWGSAASPNPFPPLASSVAVPSSRTGTGRAGPSTWSTPGASPRPSPAPSRVSSQLALNRNVAPNDSEAFPALPAAAKPTSTVFSPGYGGGAVRRETNGRAPAVNAWGIAAMATTTGTPSIAAADAADGAEAEAGQKKKGNKNKKQTLIRWG